MKAKAAVNAASANNVAPTKLSEQAVVTVDMIKRVLADAKARNDLIAPNALAYTPDFVNMLVNPATAKECWSCVEQFQLMVNSSKQVEDKAYAQALIARYANVTGREALAKKNYQASISIMQGAKHEFKFGFDLRDIYINVLYPKIAERCKIALALISCRDKKVDDAAKIYTELMKGYYDQPWYAFPRDSKAVYASRLDGDEGVAIIFLASALGKAYAENGKLDKASEKFNELVELLGPEELDSMDAQDKSMRRLVKLMFALNIHTGEAVERFDPLIGPEVSLEAALRAYLAFGDRHPELCKKADVAVVNARVERLAKVRLAREKQESATPGRAKPVAPENKKPTLK